MASRSSAEYIGTNVPSNWTTFKHTEEIISKKLILWNLFHIDTDDEIKMYYSFNNIVGRWGCVCFIGGYSM